MELVVRKLETKIMEVVPNALRMESQTVLTQYIRKNWTLDYVDKSVPSKGITMVLVFRRRIMNAILTIYLPTILVLCIVYATNFFKEFFFEAIVTVNLTALLVLTTLFISVSSALPSTAYVKMVDVWLIFAQLVPWVEVEFRVRVSVLLSSFRCCFTQQWSKRDKRRDPVISTTTERSLRWTIVGKTRRHCQLCQKKFEAFP